MHGFLANIAGKDEKYGKYCFGNLFPIRNQLIEQGKTYEVLIGSPVPSIIEKLFFALPREKTLNIGELQFTLSNIEVQKRILTRNSTIESISPVNITIHENGRIRFLRYGEGQYVSYLKKHLLKKYHFLTGKNAEIDLFNNVTIAEHEKHPFVCYQINFFNKQSNKTFSVCGSKLVFRFKDISDEQLSIFQTLFDTGFGERTTYGAGFMIERWER